MKCAVKTLVLSTLLAHIAIGALILVSTNVAQAGPRDPSAPLERPP